MPKSYTKFVCQQCGYESAKFMGRCPDCGEWNTLVETAVAAGSRPRRGPWRGARPWRPRRRRPMHRCEATSHAAYAHRLAGA